MYCATFQRLNLFMEGHTTHGDNMSYIWYYDMNMICTHIDYTDIIDK